MIDVTPDPKPVAAEPKEPKPLNKRQGFRTSPKHLKEDFRFRVLHEFGGRCLMAEPPPPNVLPGQPSVPWGEWQYGACSDELDSCHILPKQTLRKLRLSEQFVFDARNGMALCRRHHGRSDTGLERVPRELLPPSVFDFARDHHLEHLLDRLYPKKELA